jgi:hypothetical protein
MSEAQWEDFGQLFSTGALKSLELFRAQGKANRHMRALIGDFYVVLSIFNVDMTHWPSYKM